MWSAVYWLFIGSAVVLFAVLPVLAVLYAVALLVRKVTR